MGVHWKIQFLGGGFTRKQYIWGNCPKKGAWTVCRFNTGVDKKEWGGVFKLGGGGLVPQFTLWVLFSQASNKHIKRQQR